MALLAFVAVSACNGNLRVIGAPYGTDASGVGDGASHDGAKHTDAPAKTDAPAAPDALGPCPDDLPVGFATMSDVGGEWDGGTNGMPNLQIAGGVTGGGSGTQVTVNDTDANALAEFSMYASDKMPGPLTILVEGMINIPPPPDGGSGDVQKIRVSSNKTVAGVGGGSGFTGGGITLTGVSNVILRNLVIKAPNADDAGDNVDAIHIETSQQIWVDHCDLSSSGPTSTPAYDGLVDISDGSDFVTVSWTYYHDHGDTGLIGRSDSSAAAAQDASKNHVTYDHDRFNNVLTGPRARFGTVHVLNTYFQDVANFGVASLDGANVKIENSVFENVAPPPQDDADFGWVTTILESASAGNVDLVNNLTDATDGAEVLNGQAMTSVPIPYSYTAYQPDVAQQQVLSCAGAGVVAALPPTN
jgi:pectate lyase